MSMEVLLKYTLNYQQMNVFTPGIEIRVASKEDLPLVGDLAKVIFPATYENIVPEGQAEYMMQLIYSTESLIAQLEEGQVFLVIFYEGLASGFAGFSRLNTEGDFKLNKIYVDHNLHGKGLGKWLLFDVTRRVKTVGGRSLRLNVNRYNKALGFYDKMGFSKTGEELVDIGNGYFMDDYVMELKL